MPSWGRYEKLRPRQVDAILAEAPVAYIPWGALEWHSYQNPIGLDTLKVHGLAMIAAERTGGVVLPPVYAGYDTMKPWGGFRHTLETPIEVIVGLANTYLDQLADEGFKLVVILMGHYGGEHVATLTQAANNWQRVRGRGSDMKVWALPEYVLRLTQTDPVPDHAGQYETALMMFLRPELVDLGELPTEGDVVGTAPESFGISGDDPRQATAELGRRLADEIVEGIVAGVRERLGC
jgi:creatinine amidohydrolase